MITEQGKCVLLTKIFCCCRKFAFLEKKMPAIIIIKRGISCFFFILFDIYLPDFMNSVSGLVLEVTETLAAFGRMIYTDDISSQEGPKSSNSLPIE